MYDRILKKIIECSCVDLIGQEGQDLAQNHQVVTAVFWILQDLGKAALQGANVKNQRADLLIDFFDIRILHNAGLGRGKLPTNGCMGRK